MTSASPLGKNFLTPFISIASVTVRPRNPNSSRSIPVTIGLEIEEGILGAGSKLGIFIWATMIAGAPALINSLNGNISKASKRFLLNVS
ncbi:hypothetical protein D3C71_1543880 [compost metagenome]